MSQINVTNLTFAYPGSYDNIFEGATFCLDTDWRIGFTGRNGRGKTTFLRLLMGEYDYQGTISASVEFEYFPYKVENMARDTIEIVESLMSGHEEWEIYRELSLLGVEADVLYRSFETLSNGERTKVLLAAMFLKENSFLLIDEPTNHLDQKGRELVGRYLHTKKGFILVSHDRAFLDSCTDHTLSINKTDIVVQKGNFSVWWEAKQRQDAAEQAKNERLAREIGRLDASAQQKGVWSNAVEKTKHTKVSGLRPDRGYIGHKAAKMMKRSKQIEKRRQEAVEEKRSLLKNVEEAESLKLTPLSYHAARLALLRDVVVTYNGKNIFEPISFELKQGEKLWLCGGNGSGKSSLLKLILGEKVPYTGTVEIGSGLKISYVPQNASFLRGDLSSYAREQGIDESLFKAILRKLGFLRIQFEKDMADFSAGQKKKVLLARSLCEQAHLYIWDEPLNYIDIFSRMQVEQLLASAPLTLLFVEHDREFGERIATRTICLSGNSSF